MIPDLHDGPLTARLARDRRDIAAALALRGLAFGTGAGEGDRFDADALHLLVREGAGQGDPVAACRMWRHPDVAAAAGGYTGQSYDLAPLAALETGSAGAAVVELGRICTRPGPWAAGALRLVLAAVARLVTGQIAGQGAGLLLGCASFAGADPDAHDAALSHLAQMAPAPAGCLPCARVPAAVRLADRTAAPDPAGLPPLLRSYLAMGAWVGPEAVPDPALGTLHVLTVLEVARIPPARARVLRALAAAG